MSVQLQPIRVERNKGTYTNENEETYIGYGFTVFLADSKEIIFHVEDLSVDPDEVQELIRLILDNDVSPKHFEDLIEDFCV